MEIRYCYHCGTKLNYIGYGVIAEKFYYHCQKCNKDLKF